MIYASSLAPSTPPTVLKPARGDLLLVLDSLLAAHAILMEDGHGSERKPYPERKVILNLEMGEVERVLSEVGGAPWKNVLSV